MRQIDGHELLKQFTINSQDQRIPERDCDNFPITVSIAEVKRMIRAMPTIEPKQGECRFAGSRSLGAGLMNGLSGMYCETWKDFIDRDTYCSRGERRQSDG